MEGAIYSDGTYLRNNPQWHADDSAWKAGHIARMLSRNGIAPSTVCEIGCGAGEVLRGLARRMPAGTRFFGYEVSPDAHAICSRKAERDVQFRLGDFFAEQASFDVAMAIDVF